MPTQKFKNNSIRKLTKVGRGSISVTLPKNFIIALGWKDKQKVVVKKKGARLVIGDWKK